MALRAEIMADHETSSIVAMSTVDGYHPPRVSRHEFITNPNELAPFPWGRRMVATAFDLMVVDSVIVDELAAVIISVGECQIYDQSNIDPPVAHLAHKQVGRKLFL